jgi:hypothetical protein
MRMIAEVWQWKSLFLYWICLHVSTSDRQNVSCLGFRRDGIGWPSRCHGFVTRRIRHDGRARKASNGKQAQNTHRKGRTAGSHSPKTLSSCASNSISCPLPLEGWSRPVSLTEDPMDRLCRGQSTIPYTTLRLAQVPWSCPSPLSASGAASRFSLALTARLRRTSNSSALCVCLWHCPHRPISEKTHLPSPVAPALFIYQTTINPLRRAHTIPAYHPSTPRRPRTFTQQRCSKFLSYVLAD